MSLRCVLLVVAVFTIGLSKAQHAYRSGIIPQVNINVKLSEQWKLNTKIENRYLFIKGTFREETVEEYRFQLTDVSILAARKLGASKSLAGGYLLRSGEGLIFHRLIQQFTIIDAHNVFRYSHRFSTDQTFGEGEFIFRLRYRISALTSLNGVSVDPREFYLKGNLEILNIFQPGDHDLELRLVPYIGYALTDNNKFEAGLGYRLDTFIDKTPRSSIWLRISWFIRF